jgi:hypothetical protein
MQQTFRCNHRRSKIKEGLPHNHCYGPTGGRFECCKFPRATIREKIKTPPRLWVLWQRRGPILVLLPLLLATKIFVQLLIALGCLACKLRLTRLLLLLSLRRFGLKTLALLLLPLSFLPRPIELFLESLPARVLLLPLMLFVGHWSSGGLFCPVRKAWYFHRPREMVGGVLG